MKIRDKLHKASSVMSVVLLVTIALFAFQTLIPKTTKREINIKEFEGKDAYKDQFPVVIGEINEFPNAENIQGVSDEKDLIYSKYLTELPLVSYDYYYGKHINATAAANEINYIKVLEPGDRISLIGHGYLTMSSVRGYADPGGDYMYASGVCWATSALGAMMDEINKVFNQKYGKSLFLFYPGDRLPHDKSYQTYRNSNYGYGYTVVKVPGGISTDYSFTVNPSLRYDPAFKDLRIKIVMVSTSENENAFLGRSIGGYVKSNVDF